MRFAFLLTAAVCGACASTAQALTAPKIFWSNVGNNVISVAKIELVSCKTVSKTVIKKIKGKRRRVHVKVRKCTARLVSGTVKFTTTSAADATISRGHIVYARGTIVALGAGRSHLLLAQLRPLRRGRYTLTARGHHGHRVITRRMTIAIA
jgi:hypothetical protein